MSKITSVVYITSQFFHQHDVKNAVQYSFTRNCHSLQGRSILSSTDLGLEDIKTILWTAIELKELNAQCKDVCDVCDKWVTILTNKDTFYFHSLKQATRLLGLNLTKVTVDGWEQHGNLYDVRRYYERVTDMLLTKSSRHELLKPMFQPELISEKPDTCTVEDPGCSMPMFNINSQKCCLSCVLTDLMTYQQHFGRLFGLNLLWFGEVCTLINTYLPLATTLNLNMRFSCNKVTPASLYEAVHGDVGTSEQIREYNAEKDKDYRVDVVIIREKSPNWGEMRKMYGNHSPEMVILRAFPQSDVGILGPKEVKSRERHLERADNLMFVLAAILLQMMSDYKHTISQPNF